MTNREYLSSLYAKQEAIPANKDGVSYWDNPVWKEIDKEINRINIALFQGTLKPDDGYIGIPI